MKKNKKIRKGFYRTNRFEAYKLLSIKHLFVSRIVKIRFHPKTTPRERHGESRGPQALWRGVGQSPAIPLI